MTSFLKAKSFLYRTLKEADEAAYFELKKRVSWPRMTMDDITSKIKSLPLASYDNIIKKFCNDGKKFGVSRDNRYINQLTKKRLDTISEDEQLPEPFLHNNILAQPPYWGRKLTKEEEAIWAQYKRDSWDNPEIPAPNFEPEIPEYIKVISEYTTKPFLIERTQGLNVRFNDLIAIIEAMPLHHPGKPSNKSRLNSSLKELYERYINITVAHNTKDEHDPVKKDLYRANLLEKDSSKSLYDKIANKADKNSHVNFQKFIELFSYAAPFGVQIDLTSYFEVVEWPWWKKMMLNRQANICDYKNIETDYLRYQNLPCYGIRVDENNDVIKTEKGRNMTFDFEPLDVIMFAPNERYEYLFKHIVESDVNKSAVYRDLEDDEEDKTRLIRIVYNFTPTMLKKPRLLDDDDPTQDDDFFRGMSDEEIQEYWDKHYEAEAAKVRGDLELRQGDSNCVLKAVQNYIDKNESMQKWVTSTSIVEMNRADLTENPFIQNFDILAEALGYTFEFFSPLVKKIVHTSGSGPTIRFHIIDNHVLPVTNIQPNDTVKSFQLVDNIDEIYGNESNDCIISNIVYHPIEKQMLIMYTSIDLISNTEITYKDKSFHESLEKECLDLGVEMKSHYTNSHQIKYDSSVSSVLFPPAASMSDILYSSMMESSTMTFDETPAQSYDMNSAYAAYDSPYSASCSYSKFFKFPQIINQFIPTISATECIKYSGIIQLMNFTIGKLNHIQYSYLSKYVGRYIPNVIIAYLLNHDCKVEVCNLCYSDVKVDVNLGDIHPQYKTLLSFKEDNLNSVEIKILNKYINKPINLIYIARLQRRGAIVELSPDIEVNSTCLDRKQHYIARKAANETKRILIGKSYSINTKTSYKLQDEAWKKAFLQSIHAKNLIRCEDGLIYIESQIRDRPAQLRSFVLAYHFINMMESIKLLDMKKIHHIGVDNIITSECKPNLPMGSFPGQFKTEGIKQCRCIQPILKPPPQCDISASIITHDTLVTSPGGFGKSFDICNKLANVDPSLYTYITVQKSQSDDVKLNYPYITPIHYQKVIMASNVDAWYANSCNVLKGKVGLYGDSLVVSIKVTPLVIFDECMCIDEPLMRLLYKFFKKRGSIILFLGDDKQLAPIGGFSPYNFIKSVVKEHIVKTEDFRSKEEGLVIFKDKLRSCKNTLQQLCMYVANSITLELEKLHMFYKLNDIICASTREARDLVNNYMFEHRDDAEVPVRCINGIRSQKIRKGQFVLQPRDFNKNQFELAYCCTIHTLQGMTADSSRNVFLVIDRLTSKWIEGGIYMVASRVQYADQLHSVILAKNDMLSHLGSGEHFIDEPPEDIGSALFQDDLYEYNNESYKLNDIHVPIEGIILRDALENKFYGFYNRKSAYEFLKHWKGKMHFHEIISRNRPHRIYFDIDAKYDIDIGKILQHIKILFGIRYGEILVDSDIFVCESIRPDKWGYHIIIDNYAVMGVEVRILNQMLRDSLPDEMQSSVDVLGKNNQSLRLNGSYKVGGDTCYECKHRPYGQIFVQHCYGKFLESAYENTTTCKNFIFDGDVKVIVDKIESNGDFRLYEQHGSIINFKRIKPSHCDICDRIHESDNTLYVVLHADGNHKIKCRHHI